MELIYSQQFPKISVYTYLFNAKKRSFDIEGVVQNFCAFADEVVIATIPSEDDTLEELKRLQETYTNLKIVETTIPLTDNRFDGKLKTAALKACTCPIRVIADCDERFPLNQKRIWQAYAGKLTDSRQDGWLIPVIDLWGDRELVRAKTNTGVKFRMHKDTVDRRDVLPDADLGNGLFDTSKSDSTEPLLANGKLAWFEHVVSSFQLAPAFVSSLDNTPFMIHEGYLDLGRRAELSRDFWKQHWEARSGKPENVETDVEKLAKEPTIKHHLKLN